MVRKLSEDVRNEVIRLWLEGYPYRAIASRTDVSEGSIANIIHEKEKKTTDLEDIRQFISTLKKARINFLDAARGAKLSYELNSRGYSLNDLPKILDFYGKAEGGPEEIAEYGLRLLKLEEQTGLSYEKIVQDFQNKIKVKAELEPYLKNLKHQIYEAENRLPNLASLTELQDKLRKLGVAPQKVEDFIKEYLELEALGFDSSTAKTVSEELKRQSLDVNIASRKLSEAIKEFGNLKNAITTATSNLKDLDDKKDELIREVKKLSGELDELKIQKDATSGLMKDEEELHSRKVKQLDGDYQIKQQELEANHKRRNNELEEEYQKKLKDLKSQYEEQENAYEVAIKNLENELEKLTGKRDGLEGEIKDFKDALNVLMQTEEKLKQIQAEIERIRILLLTSEIIVNPENVKGGAKPVLELALAFNKGLQQYLRTVKYELGSPLVIDNSLKNLIQTLEPEMRR